MKIVKYILASMLIPFLAASCNDGIDPITPVAAGSDVTAPTISISNPTEGLRIFNVEPTISINFQVEVSDDIELQSMSFNFDGAALKTFTDFKDYRHALESLTYDQLTNGNHTFTVTAVDLTGKSTTKTVNFSKSSRYEPMFDGEIFYMPFNDNYKDLVSELLAGKVGTPGFSGGKSGFAYKGADDSYLTFPTVDETNKINLIGTEFSAAFWYKVNSSPDRAGILVISPSEAPPAGEDNNLTNGFRLFRESGNGGQTIKLNVGDGTSGNWFDGGAAATIESTNTDWNFVAFTISASKVVVYLNGNVASQGNLPGGIKWNGGCNSMSIMSGAPSFIGWSHFSDLSSMDELRIFNKALTQEEVAAIMND